MCESKEAPNNKDDSYLEKYVQMELSWSSHDSLLPIKSEDEACQEESK